MLKKTAGAALLLFAPFALGSCKGAGIDRTYVTLQEKTETTFVPPDKLTSAGKVCTTGADCNYTIFEDDVQVIATAEVSIGNPKTEVSCRILFAGLALDSRPDTGQNTDVRTPPVNDDRPHHEALFFYPGRTEGSFAKIDCKIEKPKNDDSNLQPWQVPWAFHGIAYIDWYINDTYQETVSVNFTSLHRFR